MEAKGQVVANTPIYYKDKEARDLLGKEELETTAQTCTGAINELKGTLGDLSAVKVYTNAQTISFDMDEVPTATHFGAYILFNANQGIEALIKAETNPGVNVIIGNNPMTATLSGKTITITPTNRLWGLTVVMGCEADIT
jgi:hypothetical protein